MSKKDPHEPQFAATAPVVTRRYRGPDRRLSHKNTEDVAVDVRFDAKGNPVWEMRATGPRHRKDDDTLDLLKCLNVDSLSIDGGEAGDDAGGNRTARGRDSGYNPYERAKKK